jgi:hypothetical protein
MLPELENMSGTIRAAVMVGEISAMFCANSSQKLRHEDLSLPVGGVLMGISLGIDVMGCRGLGVLPNWQLVSPSRHHAMPGKRAFPRVETSTGCQALPGRWVPDLPSIREAKIEIASEALPAENGRVAREETFVSVMTQFRTG